MINTIELSDKQIIESVLQGKVAMFEILIRRINPALYKTGRSYNYNHEDTQDLMQDTFIDAFNNLSKFEGRSSFKTWIIKIMLNNCYKKRLKFSYKNEIVNEISDKSIPMFQEQENRDADKVIFNKELSGIIESALEQIPLEYRIVFSLREINGLTVAETAETLDITEANVKVRLNRAKAMLRKLIEQTYSPAELFEFNLIYCDMMVERVMRVISDY